MKPEQYPEGWAESLHRAANEPERGQLKPWQQMVIAVLLLLISAAVCGLWIVFETSYGL